VALELVAPIGKLAQEGVGSLAGGGSRHG
jgi:hypothetical protein